MRTLLVIKTIQNIIQAFSKTKKSSFTSPFSLLGIKIIRYNHILIHTDFNIVLTLRLFLFSFSFTNFLEKQVQK